MERGIESQTVAARVLEHVAQDRAALREKERAGSIGADATECAALR